MVAENQPPAGTDGGGRSSGDVGIGAGSHSTMAPRLALVRSRWSTRCWINSEPGAGRIRMSGRGENG
jgi:hypothetical protein